MIVNELETQDFDEAAEFKKAAALVEGEMSAEEFQSTATATLEQERPLEQGNGDEGTGAAEEDADTQGQSDELPDYLKDAPEPLRNRFLEMEAENQRLQHQAKSDSGRAKAMQRKWEEAKKLLEQRNEQGESDKNTKDLDGVLTGMQEDFPELAAGIRAFLDKQVTETNSTKAALAAVIDSGVESYQQEQEQAAEAAITQAVPDVYDILKSPDFDNWLNSQPPIMRAAFDSHDPQDSIYVLNQFKSQSTARAQTVATKRQKQISSMSAPLSSAAARQGNEPDDAEALFKAFAAEIDKQQ